MVQDPRQIIIRRDAFEEGPLGDRMYFELANAFDKVNALKVVANVESLQSAVDTNTADISDNTADISDNASDISSLQDAQMYSSVSKTTNYTVLTSDVNNLIVLLGASADATFTLPSLGSANDGEIYRFGNLSDYNLIVTPSDSSYIWNSGSGYGIELPDKGTLVALRYNHTDTRWDIVNKTGGRVFIEGLVLAESLTRMHPRDVDLSTTNLLVLDSTGTKYGIVRQGVTVQEDSSGYKFNPGCLQFNGVDEYVDYADSPDWDIFGANTPADEVKTVSFWVYHNTGGSAEDYINHFEDPDNRWFIGKSSSEALRMYLFSGSVAEIALAVGSISSTTWTHIALVIKGSDVGVYIDGTQVGYAGSWTPDTFSGRLYIGQRGDGNLYLSGRMQDLEISYNNPYNADPQSDSSDSFGVPVAPFQGVMF
jgi:hypothetical protein